MMIAKNAQMNHVAVKITAEDGGAVVGRVYVYLIQNDLHQEPYGYIEDLFVEESHRGKGIGTQLLAAVVEEAKARGCYKIVGTSRNGRTDVHTFYERLGFKKYGVEFRMDFSMDFL